MAFPSTFSSLSTEALLEVFSLAPNRLRQAIDGLSPAEMRSHHRPGKWSIQQIVCHVVDAEVPGHFRILSVLGSGGKVPALAAYDQDSWTESFGYEDRSADEVRAALHFFSATREIEASRLRRLDPSDWELRGLHGEWGSVTLRQLLELYTDHPERHIDQIAAARELLGKPLALPRLLDDWLYGARP